MSDKVHDITLITGDGVGPELAALTRKAVDATGVKVNWDEQSAGVDVFEAEGTPLPERVIESIERNRLAIKAPVTTPVGKGFRSVNVALRQKLDLYSCVRPCKSYAGVRSLYRDIDLVIFRENTEDLYAGIEFQHGTEEVATLQETVNEMAGSSLEGDMGISIKPISVKATERIVTAAFEYARKHNRRKVTAVHKANIMKFSDGLFLEVSRNVAEGYTDIEFEDRIVDAMCMQLVQRPENFDVMVMPNLYGDILSDLCAGLVGGLGVAPGANIGDGCAVFEATHGTAPKYAGQDKVNPCAMLLSAVMMLDYMDEGTASRRLETAIARVIARGEKVTYDLKDDRNDPTAVGSTAMTDAIIDELAKLD
ncbi:MAG: isocitrate/isopropylmalate dehydrogenase family protein [Planctomycetota bacterium]